MGEQLIGWSFAQPSGKGDGRTAAVGGRADRGPFADIRIAIITRDPN